MACKCNEFKMCDDCINTRINKLKSLSVVILKHTRVGRSDASIGFAAISVAKVFKYLAIIEALENASGNGDLNYFFTVNKKLDDITFEQLLEFQNSCLVLKRSYIYKVIKNNYKLWDMWTLENYLNSECMYRPKVREAVKLARSISNNL